MVLTRQLNTLMGVIPAKAGIQKGPGCRIKSGMTDVAYLIAGAIKGFEYSISKNEGIRRDKKSCPDF